MRFLLKSWAKPESWKQKYLIIGIIWNHNFFSLKFYSVMFPCVSLNDLWGRMCVCLFVCSFICCVAITHVFQYRCLSAPTGLLTCLFLGIKWHFDCPSPPPPLSFPTGSGWYGNSVTVELYSLPDRSAGWGQNWISEVHIDCVHWSMLLSDSEEGKAGVSSLRIPHEGTNTWYTHFLLLYYYKYGEFNYLEKVLKIFSHSKLK